jgi:hypothetical protein
MAISWILRINFMGKQLHTLLCMVIALTSLSFTALAEDPAPTPTPAPTSTPMEVDETPGEVYVAATLGMASEAKISVTEYFLMNEELPGSNKQAGLGEPESYASEDSPLISLHILQGGIVELTYNETSGVKGGKVRFVPMPMGPKLEWKCEAADYPGLSKYVSGC